MTKDEARALIREKKKALTAEYRAEANAEIRVFDTPKPWKAHHALFFCQFSNIYNA